MHTQEMIRKIAKVDINGRGQFGEALQPCNLQLYIALALSYSGQHHAWLRRGVSSLQIPELLAYQVIGLGLEIARCKISQ
jgi:hypothetical protein